MFTNHRPQHGKAKRFLVMRQTRNGAWATAAEDGSSCLRIKIKSRPNAHNSQTVVSIVMLEMNVNIYLESKFQNYRKVLIFKKLKIPQTLQIPERQQNRQLTSVTFIHNLCDLLIINNESKYYFYRKNNISGSFLYNG